MGIEPGKRPWPAVFCRLVGQPKKQDGGLAVNGMIFGTVRNKICFEKKLVGG